MFSKRLIFALLMVVIMVSSFGLDARAAGTVTVDWVQQDGTSGIDYGRDVVADSSGIYVVGEVYGALPGQTYYGGTDAFVRKYDESGNEIWTRQFATNTHDYGMAIAKDASGIYVAGYTNGVFPGQTRPGYNNDVFVRKYDLNGNEVWTRQFGTTANDVGLAITVDSSGIYVAGQTTGTMPGQTYSGSTDAFVSRFDLYGVELWTRQFGSTHMDWIDGIAVDSSGVYVAGVTWGGLPGQPPALSPDGFVRKYDLNGDETWTYQLDVTDYMDDIVADGSAIYVAGTTPGTLPGQTSSGGYDAFVRKYDPDGVEIWTRQFGTANGDLGYRIALDGSGVYLTGWTNGTFPGLISAGGTDIYVRKYDFNGVELWTGQFGTTAYDRAEGIAVHGSGIYVSGYTQDAFPGFSNLGSYDIFVARLSYDDGNQAPLADAGGPYHGTEGAAILLDGTASIDPDADTLGYSWSVDSALCAFSDASLVSPSLTCAQDGSFTVTLEVSDGQESHTASASVLVNNAAPALTNITAPIDPVQVNTAIAASAAFTDAGTLDIHTAVWDWGDGTTSSGSVSESGGSGSVADSHTYTGPGVYTLSLTVSDQDGGDGFTTFKYVVVYDPNGGFVTGGGWFQSPLGACQMQAICADVEAKATFGFVSKYQKGANVPTGNTQFHFDAGGFIFKSDSYDWLVVNQGGTNAQFKGYGLVNDQLAPTGAAYRFMIWAGDGTGAGGADTFRIKIWYDDGGTEVVVYDNGFDQPVTNGQIRVHK